MKIKLFLLAFMLSALFLPSVSGAAKTGSMKILAMAELEDGVYKGSIADLELEIIPGKGRVFVNTFPTPKIDTQISMRFAKQIACKNIGADCSRYDFIYTIKAESGIVGGPSAGAAASVLAVALLSNQPLKKDTTITGTINSGELIGPVGGIKEKIDVAALEGIKTVLIPWGSIETNNETNITAYSKEIDIDVIEVSTLSEALYYFTGKKIEKPKKELVVDPEYKRVMKNLAVMLCNKSTQLQENYLNSKPKNNINKSILKSEESAINATESAARAFELGDYYTAASYCFRANINYKYLSYYFQNLSSEEIKIKAEKFKNNITNFEKGIDKKEINTLTDLQAYMITKERIVEAEDNLENAFDNLNKTDKAIYWLAFAEERLFSAFSWSYFFGAKGQNFILDNESLKNSCEIKISEAEESYQYVNFYFPATLFETRKEIGRAKKDMKKGDYIMCLHKASRAKSQANVILSVMGVDRPLLNNTFKRKLEAAEQVIIEQQENGIFPIMGFSYFEYANSLSEEDVSSAIIYAEYALELSNFDFYFEEKMPFKMLAFEYIDSKDVTIFILGIIIGFLISIKIRKSRKIKTKKKTKQ